MLVAAPVQHTHTDGRADGARSLTFALFPSAHFLARRLQASPLRNSALHLHLLAGASNSNSNSETDSHSDSDSDFDSDSDSDSDANFKQQHRH